MSASEDSEPFIIPTSVPPAFRAHYKRMVIVHALAPVSLTTLELQRICSSLRKWEQTWLVPLSASGSSSSSSSSSCSSRESTPLSTPKSSPAPSRTNSTLSVDSNSSTKASLKKRKNTKRKSPSTPAPPPTRTPIPPIPNLIPKIPKQIPETDYFSAIVQLNSLSSLVEIGLQNVDAEMERVQNEFNEMAREAHAQASAKARARARAGVVTRARNLNADANGSGSGSGSEDGEGEEDVNAHIAFLLASAMLKLGELEREKKICDDTHAFYVDLTQRIYDLCYA